MSHSNPAFVAIDRFGCERVLLGGHALLHVPHAQLAVWRRTWEAIRDSDGLVERVSPSLERGSNAAADIAEAIAVINHGLDDAEARQRDLVLACVLA